MTLSNMIAGVMGLHRLGSAAPYLAALLAIPFAWIVHWIGGFPLLVVGTVIGVVKVMIAAGRATCPLIGDRMIGVWLALWPLSGGLWFAGVEAHIFPWPGWVGAFLVFSLCISLPPIRRLGARHVLLDDIVAGAIAAVIVLASAAISHGWI